MKRGQLAHTTITESTDVFDVKNMLSPNFVNNGNTTAVVFFQNVPPGGQFAFDFPSIILDGSISVKFLPPSSGVALNLINVYYGTIKCN